MLTPQQVQSQKFVKAVFGGYDMSAVDEFLNALTADYTTLFKENAVLKSKLKVLVESIEEYRSVDESMRRALMAAQKMANDLVEDARGKAEQILAEASAKAESQISSISRDVKLEENRLNAAKGETAQFISAVRALYTQQLKVLDAVPEIEFEETPPIRQSVPETIEVKTEAAARAEAIVETPAEPPQEQDAQPAAVQPESAAPAQPDENEKTVVFKAQDSEPPMEFDLTVFDELTNRAGAADTDPKPRFDFENLQFGDNFSLGKKEKK